MSEDIDTVKDVLPDSGEPVAAAIAVSLAVFLGAIMADIPSCKRLDINRCLRQVTSAETYRVRSVEPQRLAVTPESVQSDGSLLVKVTDSPAH